MKIVCDACSAKYSISDDKVQGKVYKIRCKKCSNIIVVRGTAGAAAAAEPSQSEKDTRVFDYGYDESSGGESVWHVVVDQDQVGPLTAAEVRQRFQAKQIDAETYIWKEGFADWLPLNQVDTFAALLGGGEGAAASNDDSGSLFGGAPEPHGGGGAAALGDLFGGAESSAPKDDDGGMFAPRRSAEAPDSAAQAKLRGERSENSVLFSLSNLAQLASDAPRPQASSSSAPSSFSTAQHGGGEGSGLIDIRSMASAYLSPDRGGAKSATATMAAASELPVFSSAGFGEPAVIVPIVRNTGTNNKLLYGLIGLVGLLAVIAVVMVVVLLRGDKPVAKVDQLAMGATGSGSDVAADTPSGEPATAPTPDGAGATPPPTATAVPDAPPPSAAPEVPAAPAERPRDGKKTDSSKRTPKERTSSSSSSGAAAPKPAEDKPKPSKPSSSDCDAVACLVDPSQACCSKRGGGAKPSSGGSSGSKVDSNLPEQLDSSMIKAGIDKVKGKAQACGSKSSAKGAVKVRIKATPEGRVGSVDVVSSPDDALGSCVASALRGATFAKTQRGMGFAYTLSF
jgi:predicted Zn finger-like uncharacterized protein